MKDQINTIRAGLAIAIDAEGFVDKPVRRALLDALTALSDLESHLAQYEAGDMASAAAQGFRDGVASVAQQPQAPTESVLIDGIAYDIPTPVAAELLRLHIEARQPQADSIPVAAFDRLMALCESQAQRIIELEDKQPQAEAVPSSDLNPDEGDPVTLWAEIWRLREAVKGPDGYATWQDAATAERIRRVRAESKQAEEAKAVPTHDDTDLIKQMLEDLRSCSGVSHWPALIPTINAARKRLETPQQAEAVPSDVARDAERLDYLQKMGATVELLPGIEDFYPMRFRVGGWHASESENIRDAIDAAIAQQKGGTT